MEATQLFLNINKPGLDNEWNKQINSIIKQLNGVESVTVIEENENSKAQLNISYDVQKLPFDKIEEVVKNSGATITEINIHFPSGVSGTTDPYGASAKALSINDELNKINGVLGAAISTQGIIKIELATVTENKQNTIEQVLKKIISIRLHRS